MARSRSPQILRKKGRYAMRPVLDGLEDRRLMAAPVLDPIADVTVPLNKSRIIPITASDASDADGNPLTYTVTRDGGPVSATVHHGNTYLKLSVQNFGDMTFQLFNDLAPKTVSTITGLVNQGFYNGLTFHRIVPNFVIQGGDPAGNGSGGPGFSFDDEFNPEAIFSGDGQLAMANSGKDTNGSQFFVTLGQQRFLDFNHTIYGQLVRGFDVLRVIDAANPPVKITSASIVTDTTDAVITLDDVGTGATNFTVTVSDGQGGTASRTFKATSAADVDSNNVPINDPPILGPVSNQLTAMGRAIQIPLSSTDLEGDAVTYAASITSTPAHGTVSVSGNIVTVTPDSGYTGDIPLLVQVKQTNATTRGSTSDPYDKQAIKVSVISQALNAQGNTLSTTEGSTLVNATFASFSPSIAISPPRFSASIDFGDGAPIVGTVAPAASGGYVVTANRSFFQIGNRPYTVTIREVSTGASATATGTVSVMEIPIAGAVFSPTLQTDPVSGAVSGPFVAFNVANPTLTGADFQASFTWGDGTTSAGSVARVTASGIFAVSGSKVYSGPGVYPVGVSITRIGGRTVNVGGNVTIDNRAPVITAIGTQQVSEGSTLQLKVAGGDPDAGQTVRYSLAPGAPDGATIDPTSGLFSWTPSDGPRAATIGVQVTDSGSPSKTTTTSFQVNVLNVAPTVVVGGDDSILEGGTLSRIGGFIDPGADTWSATVDYGDGSGTQPLALTADKRFSLSHTYSTPGTFYPVVFVKDKDGAVGGAAFAETVVALPKPVVKVVSTSAVVKRGVITSITLTLDGPVDGATNLGNDAIVTAGRDRKLNTRDDVTTRFGSVSYDPNKHTITLIPKGRFAPSGQTQLRVSGLNDRYGRLFDGDRDGNPGGVFVATLSRQGIS